MIAVLYLSSILIGSAGAWGLKKIADRWDFVDQPNKRSSHDKPTPKGGEIGILVH